MAINIPKGAKGFGILHLNIRSLLKHKDELSAELLGYDIIALTETWLTPRVIDRMIDIDEYTLLRQDRVAKTAAGKEKRGGGVCIYIKSELIPHVSLLPDICQNDKDSEEMWISLAKPGNKKILLGVIYKPPEGVPKLLLDRLNSVLSQYIGKGNPNGKEIYIIGDFNVDYSRCSKDTTKIKLKDLEVKYNLRQLIKNPTRETKTCKSIIDLLSGIVTSTFSIISSLDGLIFQKGSF